MMQQVPDATPRSPERSLKPPTSPSSPAKSLNSSINGSTQSHKPSWLSDENGEAKAGNKSGNLPTIVVQGSQTQRDEKELSGGVGMGANLSAPSGSPNAHAADDADAGLERITTNIPTGGFGDFSSPDKLSFSNRGSIYLEGKRAELFEQSPNKSFSKSNSPTSVTPTPSPALANQLRSEESRSKLMNPADRQSRTLSTVEAESSQRLRAMYEFGHEKGAESVSPGGLAEEPLVEEDDEVEAPSPAVPEAPAPSSPALSVGKTCGAATGSRSLSRQTSFTTQSRRTSYIREPHETAGGIEDWADVAGGDVDRYGFILPKKAESRGSTNSGTTFESPRMMRLPTALAEASESPRQKRAMRRAPSKARSVPASGSPQRRTSRRSLHPPASIYSIRSNSSVSLRSPARNSAIRISKDRRLLSGAGDMLTPPPGMGSGLDSREDSKAAAALRAREARREKKWKKMAKVVDPSSAKSGSKRKGGGMIVEFDVRDPKVVSRTWKGVPDSWRSAAWWSFLAASAKSRPECGGDDELRDAFQALQEENCADDVQIDCDVPRTINSHIMFRRRYRGGQRLLFRVLHAMALYFPRTGYVQGMACLAATLLCYYAEEEAFVMMVRLWQLRGLERLYADGFDGLMDALSEFERDWLRGGEIAQKLDELSVSSTAYGTRWYLTLFNYSLPFPAQLRVWDVFMLLGDASHSVAPDPPFGADLDVLHATSTALIDATRDILVDADFDNAMKVLTSWIPVKDEDLLMRVVHTEWKLRKKRGVSAPVAAGGKDGCLGHVVRVYGPGEGESGMLLLRWLAGRLVRAWCCGTFREACGPWGHVGAPWKPVEGSR
ncbi:RabGAP/TBC [Trichodelitschia bisporula]|uniref:RabGAP/TBC n=1 Tax=Trichodelitschia bisporula TaxID=703511 RepID=A0A6G1I2L1_9PEZI|nr:RabGAP/TBC [Trichodelitschia bisporula]